MPSNFRSYIGRIAPPVLRSEPGKRLVGVIALAFDLLGEAARQAVRSSWVGDRPGNGPAYDALGPAGEELSLPRYPNETWPQYHARLQSAWDTWLLSGHETTIIAQLAALGYPGARIFYSAAWTWSEFEVFFASALHSVGAAPLVGAFVVGDGTNIGPTGITPIEILTLRSIIKKFKPAHWVCRTVTFELSGWTIGTGHIVGETDLLIGGDAVYLGV